MDVQNAPIGNQTTLPVAQFVPDEPIDSLPVASPVQVIDAHSANTVEPHNSSLADPYETNAAAAGKTGAVESSGYFSMSSLVMGLLSLGALGAVVFLVYHFVIRTLLDGSSDGTFKTPSPSSPPVPDEEESEFDKYGIDFFFVPSPTPLPTAILSAFQTAKDRWQRILVSPGMGIRIPAGFCLCDNCELRQYDGTEQINNLEILVEIALIDGPGAVLGSAGPCLVILNDWRTITGSMEFDIADLQAMANDGYLADVITHEMAHVLGFGTSWGQGAAKLVDPVVGPEYKGINGKAGFNSLGGVGYPLIEMDGNEGTKFGHWDEYVLCTLFEFSQLTESNREIFGSELMTGYVHSSGSNPLSLLSIRAMQDLNYIVKTSAADPFTLPPPIGRRLRGGHVGDSVNQHSHRNRTGRRRIIEGPRKYNITFINP